MSVDPLKLPRGGGEFGKEIEASEVDPWFLTQLQAALKSPLLVVPKPFETWMIDKVASAGFDLPISQIVGFSQFTANVATRLVDDTDITSTTFADPAVGAAGPALTGLPAGEYLILFGARLVAAAAANLFVGMKVNTTEAVDNDSIITATTTAHPGVTAIVKTLTEANNTLTMRYRTTSGTANAKYRWMIALRIANA